MRSISSNAPVCARSASVVAALAALVVSACGAATASTAAPDPAASPGPAPAEAAVTTSAAPALADQSFTCTSTTRTRTKIQAKGLLSGAAPSQVRVTILATGGLLNQVASPALDPAFDRGIWVTTYAMAPWDLSAGAPGGSHLVLPTKVGPAFAAYLVALTLSGTHTILPMACSLAPPPLVAPPAGPAGAAVRTVSCASVLMPAAEAIHVAAGLDAGDRPRDILVTMAASGTAVAAAPSPAYDPAFDGGAWAIQSRLLAWGLGAGPTATHTLLLPGAPVPAAFDAVSIADYGAGGRVVISLACTAR